ncbi:MAG: ABC transporter permease/substrate-binding protein [Bacteroidota bacterium]
MQALWQFFSSHADDLWEQTLEHLGLTFLSLFFALMVGVPLGIWIVRKERLAPWVNGLVGMFQTIPSIALLGFLIPILGIGVKPAIFALFLYALLPIVRNTYTGIKEVAPEVKDAARGIGFTPIQVLQKVELPLALPVLFAGIRTATVINVGVATLAAYIAAGGLGEYIFAGIALNNPQMILAGAIPAALLALLLDQLLAALQRLPLKTLSRVMLAILVSVPVIALASWAWPSGTQEVTAGFPPEFTGRPDGYPGLQRVYGLDLEVKSMNNALMYDALKAGEVDVISGYATDGRVKAYNLKVLEDNLHAFPPYDAIPLVREEVLEQFPALETILGRLGGRLPDSVMARLNYEADFLKQEPQEIAQRFLISQHLLPADTQYITTLKELTIGSKIFTEQYILVEMFRQLIEGYTNVEVVAQTGLGGTKICFDALTAGEIDVYPEYTGTALLVLLKADSLVDITRPQQVLQFVDSTMVARHELAVLPPLGFNNTYALMMRQGTFMESEPTSISELVQLIQNSGE